MRPATLSLVVVALLGAPVVAKTWYVGGSGADFDQIQPAIDAAQDGDSILVRPGTYQTFTLAKGVMVSASSTPFKVKQVYPDRVVIENIGVHKRAGVAGMSILHDPDDYHASYVLVEVHASPGEVVLSDLSLTTRDTSWCCPGPIDSLLIQDCGNVSVTGLSVTREQNLSYHGPVRIERSSVRLSEVTVRVGKQMDCVGLGDGGPGAPAIEVTGSFVVISGEDLEAGKGGDACSPWHGCGTGGRGGDGIAATNSHIVLLGFDDRHSHQVRGGDGGDVTNTYNDCYGGDGGDGFSGKAALMSNVTLQGGAAGWGPVRSGQPGAPWEGQLTEDDIMPYLVMSGDFRPGGAFQLDLDVVVAGSLLFVFADHQGFVTVPGNAGPPLGAVPGGRFITFYGGHLGALGHLTLPLLLPNDPSLRGIPVSSQCAVLSDGGGVILSNASTRVVGE